jgi:hypothetical protein
MSQAEAGAAAASVHRILDQIRLRLNLEAEAENEVLEEIRGHLEDAMAAEMATGQDPDQALAAVAARFGIEESALALQATHTGWGTLNGIALAALPVIFTLILRWLIFLPAGTASGWAETLTRPAFWAVVVAAMVAPLLHFSRRRYVLALWTIFWALSLATTLWPTLRW